MNLREVGSILISVPPRSLQDQIAQVMQEAYATRSQLAQEAEVLLSNIKIDLEKMILGGRVIEDSQSDKSYVVPISKLLNAKRFDIHYFRPEFAELDNLLSSLPQVKFLREIADIDYGFMSTEDYTNLTDEIPLIRVTNINSDTSIDMSNIKYVRETLNRLQDKLVQENDILMVQCRNTTGKIAIVPKEFEGYASASFCFRIRAKTDVVLPRYLLAVLYSNIGFRQVWRSITYATVRPNITKPYTQSIQIPIHPKVFQQEIAEFMQDRLQKMKNLRSQAEAVFATAKARVERMILGEEVGDG